MKEATGELNMTVVTIIAIGAVIAFFWLMWPSIQDMITGTFGRHVCVQTDGNGNCIEYADVNKDG